MKYTSFKNPSPEGYCSGVRAPIHVAIIPPSGYMLERFYTGDIGDLHVRVRIVKEMGYKEAYLRLLKIKMQ